MQWRRPFESCAPGLIDYDRILVGLLSLEGMHWAGVCRPSALWRLSWKCSTHGQVDAFEGFEIRTMWLRASALGHRLTVFRLRLLRLRLRASSAQPPGALSIAKGPARQDPQPVPGLSELHRLRLCAEGLSLLPGRDASQAGPRATRVSGARKAYQVN